MSRLPYRRLDVWRRSKTLAHQILDIAESEPFVRKPWLRDQLCRAALSVPANIAEGNGRGRLLDYASYVDRARGSLFEVDTWLDIAAERGMIDNKRHAQLGEEIRQLSAMMLALRNKLRTLAREGGFATPAD